MGVFVTETSHSNSLRDFWRHFGLCRAAAHSDWCFFAPCINILTYLLTFVYLWRVARSRCIHRASCWMFITQCTSGSIDSRWSAVAVRCSPLAWTSSLVDGNGSASYFLPNGHNVVSTRHSELPSGVRVMGNAQRTAEHFTANRRLVQLSDQRTMAPCR